MYLPFSSTSAARGTAFHDATHPQNISSFLWNRPLVLGGTDDPGIAPKQHLGYPFERIGVGLFHGMDHVVTDRSGRSGASSCSDAVAVGSGELVILKVEDSAYMPFCSR